jgi:hypothetical protein
MLHLLTQGLGFLRHGQPGTLPDPMLVAARAKGPTQDGLTLPHWPPLEETPGEHQLTLATAGKHRDLLLGCTCGAEIETRSCWATSEARKVWQDWHDQEGAKSDD